MKKLTFAVIGLGRFGSAMANTLTELGQDVIGIDANEERVQRHADTIRSAMQLDANDERALRAAGVQDVDVAVISIGENIEKRPRPMTAKVSFFISRSTPFLRGTARGPARRSPPARQPASSGRRGP
jgi:Trk K+ transport system NAD-binding subunit